MIHEGRRRWARSVASSHPVRVLQLGGQLLFRLQLLLQSVCDVVDLLVINPELLLQVAILPLQLSHDLSHVRELLLCILVMVLVLQNLRFAMPFGKCRSHHCCPVPFHLLTDHELRILQHRLVLVELLGLRVLHLLPNPRPCLEVKALHHSVAFAAHRIQHSGPLFLMHGLGHVALPFHFLHGDSLFTLLLQLILEAAALHFPRGKHHCFQHASLLTSKCFGVPRHLRSLLVYHRLELLFEFVDLAVLGGVAGMSRELQLHIGLPLDQRHAHDPTLVAFNGANHGILHGIPFSLPVCCCDHISAPRGHHRAQDASPVAHDPLFYARLRGLMRPSAHGGEGILQVCDFGVVLGLRLRQKLVHFGICVRLLGLELPDVFLTPRKLAPINESDVLGGFRVTLQRTKNGIVNRLPFAPDSLRLHRALVPQLKSLFLQTLFAANFPLLQNAFCHSLGLAHTLLVQRLEALLNVLTGFLRIRQHLLQSPSFFLFGGGATVARTATGLALPQGERAGNDPFFCAHGPLPDLHLDGPFLLLELDACFPRVHRGHQQDLLRTLFPRCQDHLDIRSFILMPALYVLELLGHLSVLLSLEGLHLFLHRLCHLLLAVLEESGLQLLHGQISPTPVRCVESATVLAFRPLVDHDLHGLRPPLVPLLPSGVLAPDLPNSTHQPCSVAKEPLLEDEHVLLRNNILAVHRDELDALQLRLVVPLDLLHMCPPLIVVPVELVLIQSPGSRQRCLAAPHVEATGDEPSSQNESSLQALKQGLGGFHHLADSHRTRSRHHVLTRHFRPINLALDRPGHLRQLRMNLLGLQCGGRIVGPR
mmetsp:Transcript_30801/g.89490  ORF Transcript_30801/g.89490 Transcript_30801/m.89490 type:complete len:820 (+) Transcript_30801:573-3032(+)